MLRGMRKAAKPAGAPKRTGRPVKLDEERKDDIIRVRVTAEQKAAFATAAARAGYDVSTWLRGLGVREAQRSEASGPDGG